MKTIKSITILIGTLALMFSLNLNAAVENYKFEEETYINDIPFSTGCVTADYLYEKAINEVYNFEEESYINDIPFNTKCVSANCRYQKAIKEVFNLNEESYIDDIPFNTYAFLNTTKRTSFASNN